MKVNFKFSKLLKKIPHLPKPPKSSATTFVVINLLLIIFQLVYLGARMNFLNAQIPLWYSMPWGGAQMAEKNNIFIIPLTSFSIFVVALLAIKINRFFIRYISGVLFSLISAINILLAASLVRTVLSASIPFSPFIDPNLLTLFIPFVISFITVFLVLPYFINQAERNRLVTNPQLHSHPAMILQKPSARGGGFVYGIIFLVLAFIFVGFEHRFVGLYLSVALLAFLGLIDDFQNTHPSSNTRLLENPLLRLFLLFVCVTPALTSGLRIDFIGNPFTGVINFSQFTFNIGVVQIPYISAIVTAVWIVWVLNVLSWSNGIDGQYCGIIGIASVMVAILSLRFSPLLPFHRETAALAAISAGAAFGFTKYTWHPSKIMWGFGAMTAGLVISALSISIQSKIGTSLIIIMIPFLDAVVTAARRILQGKNPLQGDKGHLHHILLDKGFSPQKIALFYWAATAFCGLLLLVVSEKYLAQAAMVVSGIIAFVIILLNLQSIREKKLTQKPASAPLG